MVMIKIKLLSGTPVELTAAQGLQILAACLPMAFVGYFSAIGQARVAASGVSVVAKKPAEQSKAMVLSAIIPSHRRRVSMNAAARRTPASTERNSAP